MEPMQVKRIGRASDHVFELVVDDVVSGKLEPGSRLTETMLVQRSGLGRGPVREALNRLEERGLVLREPNFSCRISAFTNTDILDMIQVRAALEALASRLAAENATSEQLEHIREYLHLRAAELSKRDGTARIERRSEIDLGFHDRIANASGNSKLIKILCQDFYSTLRIWRRHQTDIVLNAEEDAKEHWKILEAIESREPEIAEFLMRRHIEKIRETYVNAFEKASSSLQNTNRKKQRVRYG